jgi:hypothetical protein
MPERLGADKKQKIASAHADLVAALSARAISLTDDEANRLRNKLAAYIGKTNPEHIDIPTIADAVAEKMNASPQSRDRWFQKAGKREVRSIANLNQLVGKNSFLLATGDLVDIEAAKRTS